jgi:hypothetical protein
MEQQGQDTHEAHEADIHEEMADVLGVDGHDDGMHKARKSDKVDEGFVRQWASGCTQVIALWDRTTAR